MQKKKQIVDVLSLLVLQEYAIQPEVSSPPDFRIQGGPLRGIHRGTEGHTENPVSNIGVKGSLKELET